MNCGMGLGIDKYYIPAKCESCPFPECYEPEVRKAYMKEYRQEKMREKEMNELMEKKCALSPKEFKKLMGYAYEITFQERVACLKKQLRLLGYHEGINCFEDYEPDDYNKYYNEVW